jgi:hypothetical protein
MSPLESRAWLALCSLCPPYIVYFAIQIGSPGWPATMIGRIACLAAAAGAHAAFFLAGLLALRARERGQGLLSDERDRGIDARATRVAYFVLLGGAIAVGMIQPFRDSGWKIVNSMLLVIVLSEVARNAMVLMGYRGTPRLAH